MREKKRDNWIEIALLAACSCIVCIGFQMIACSRVTSQLFHHYPWNRFSSDDITILGVTLFFSLSLSLSLDLPSPSPSFSPSAYLLRCVHNKTCGSTAFGWITRSIQIGKYINSNCIRVFSAKNYLKNWTKMSMKSELLCSRNWFRIHSIRSTFLVNTDWAIRSICISRTTNMEWVGER